MILLLQPIFIFISSSVPKFIYLGIPTPTYLYILIFLLQPINISWYSYSNLFIYLGIPTPNLSGILTGIKPLPLFSLPGVRMDVKHDDKTVPFVLGIPGPYSQSSSRPLTSSTSSISLTSTSSLQYSNSSYLSGVNLSTRITSSPTQSFQTITSPPPSLPSGYIPAGQLGFIKPSDSLPTLLSPIPPRERHLSAPSNRSPKPDPKPTLDIDVKRPQSLPLGGPLSLKKNITLSGASLISPETPRQELIFRNYFKLIKNFEQK